MTLPEMATPVQPAQVEPIGDAPHLGRPVMMSQSWREATFLHWAIPPEAVAARMPPGVVPDVRDGVTWVSLVPFRMVGAGLGRGPGVPWLGTFLETNVRLYSVDSTGRRGIVFLTLECDRAAVVTGARAAFGLPYRFSRLTFDRRGDQLAYLTRGRGARATVTSRVVVDLGGELNGELDGEDADLARWLTARWGLHQQHLGLTWYVPNQHEPWPLRRARVVALADGLLAATGFGDLSSRPPDAVAFSPGVRTRFALPGNALRPRTQATSQRAGGSARVSAGGTMVP